MKIISIVLISLFLNCLKEFDKKKSNQTFLAAIALRASQRTTIANTTQVSSSHSGKALEFYDILVSYRQTGSYTLADGRTRTFLNASRCPGTTSDHPALIRAAQKHTENMIRGNFFAHTGQDNSSPSDRVKAEGLDISVGENIAAGQRTAESVFDAWWNSSGHRRNMEACTTHVGIGYANKIGINSVANFSDYWTNVFATIR